MKRVISVFIALMLVLSTVPLAVIVSAENGADETEFFASPENAAVYIRDEMKENAGEITMSVSEDILPGLCDLDSLFGLLFEHTGDGSEGDYLHSRVSDISMECSMMPGSKPVLTFAVTYKTTASQEKDVSEKLAKIYKKIKPCGKYENEIVGAVHDYICKNVKYDFENLANSEDLLKYTAYAALFRGKAVCEGYSNLCYRMLNDLGIDCRIITSDDHAWNIVKIGGIYYNLDCTFDENTDSLDWYLKGSGFFNDHTPEKQFLTESFVSGFPLSEDDFADGATSYYFEHAKESFFIENETTPTCKDPRTYESVVRCRICGEEISRNPVVTGEYAPHEFDEGKITKEPTCGEYGEKTLTCAVCGKKQTEPVPKTDKHVWDKGTVTVAPLCEEDGEKTFVCTVCGETYAEPVEAAGHDYPETPSSEIPPTCVTDGEAVFECVRCGNPTVRTLPATGVHTWDDGEITAEPTCRDEGTKTFTCEVCGETKTEAVPKTEEHVWDEGTVTVAPLCEEEGEMTFVCTVCGETKTEVMEAKGHTPSAIAMWETPPTCVADGKAIHQCYECGKNVEEILPATGVHSWDDGEITEEPTCRNEGTKTLTCAVCGETKTEAVPKTEDHVWDEGTVTVAPLCEAEGEMTFVCTVCGETKTEVLEASGHTPSAIAMWETPPTCVTDGKAVHQCYECGKNVEEILPATGVHSWDDGEITQAPTCKEKGTKTFTCAVCGETKTESVPKTGEHAWDEGTVTVAATCEEEGEMTYVCAVCGKTRTEVIPLAEHTPGGDKSYGILLPPTCTVCAMVEVHDTCKVCGAELQYLGFEKFSDPTGHKDLDGDGYCDMCDYYMHLGDLTSDGTVKANDARLLLRYAAELEDLNEEQLLAADVNHDGKVDSADARHILRAAADLEKPAEW